MYVECKCEEMCSRLSLSLFSGSIEAKRIEAVGQGQL